MRAVTSIVAATAVVALVLESTGRARRSASLQRDAANIGWHAAGRWPAARHAREGSARGRAALPDQRQRQRSADLRHRCRRPQGRLGGDARRIGARLPAREHQRHSRRHVFGAGADSQVRDLQARRRPHGEDADGSRRGPAVGARARQRLQHAADRSRSIRARAAPSRSRSTRPSSRCRSRRTPSTSSTTRS